MEINNLDQYLYLELQSLFSIESQLIDILPLMISYSTSEDLKNGLIKHLETTKKQKIRLEDISQYINIQLVGHEDEAVRCLIEDGIKTINRISDSAIKDVAIIATAGKIEHYEMASYENTKILVSRSKRNDIAKLLNETHDEEVKASKELNTIFEGNIFDRLVEAIKK